MKVNDSNYIHIIGMYKSGTSWLTHILAAHPSVIAWREFDILQATYKETRKSFFLRAANRYRAMRYQGAEGAQKSQFVLKEKDSVIRDIFCGRGWVPLMGQELRAKAEALDYSASGDFIDSLIKLAGKAQLGRDGRPLLNPASFSNTLGFTNTTKGDSVWFLDAIKQSDDISRVPSYFFEYLQRQCEPNTPIVLKAADQIMRLKQLQRHSPESKKIAIIRDGRDAAISATHFGKLMRKWDSPWAPPKRHFTQQLRSWAARIRVLSNYARANDVTILRYEDFQRDFFGVAEALFRHLDLPISEEGLVKIHAETNFSAVTGGRKPGDAAEHLVRKGVIGEWKTALTAKEASQAWAIAGTDLERFGYTENGEYVDSVSGLLSANIEV